MMGSAVEQLGRREREAKCTSMPLRTPSMSERNGFRKRNMSASGHFRPVSRFCLPDNESGPKVAATNWGAPRVNDRRICRTLSGNKRCCIMTRVPCLAIVPCWPDGRAFLQGKQQGEIPFAIAPMVTRCASCSEHRVARPYPFTSVFSRINLERNAPRPSRVLS
jgi:hypothetical protein